jgi:rhamnosyl/mannosyltransferase
MLNVLQIATFFTEHGGVEKSVSDLSHALSERHEVQVLCTTRGQDVQRTAGKISVTAAGSLISVSGRPVSPGFVRELNKRSCDVAHYHLPCPMAMLADPFAAPKAKIKVATWHHDLVRHKLFNAVTRPLVQRFLDSVDRIIVTAPALIEATPILRSYRDKCEVIPLGIDDSRFANVDHGEISDVRGKFGHPLVLYVGRLVYYKGCEVLIKAIRRTKNAQLVMVGTGPLQQELLQLIESEGVADRVQMVGWQSDQVLRTLFQACDLFVLPSTLPTECFGLVQVEAMLCGKPVINTNLPTGVPWVSTHGDTGLTVEPGDIEGLARSIQFLLDDHELRQTYGSNARRKAQEMFTLKRQCTQTVRLYNELLSSKNEHAAQLSAR